jgi:hypothetical protein
MKARLIETCRPEGHCSPEAYLPRNVRSRHVMGLLSRPRSYVLRQIPSKTSRIFRGCSKLPAGYRGFDVGYKSFEEGTRFVENPSNKC